MIARRSCLPRRESGEKAASQPVDYGYRTLRWRCGRWVFRVPLRSLLVCAVLLAVAFGCAVVAMGVGDYPLSPGQVLRALVGEGERFPTMVVRQWRLPVAIAAVVFGALLGLGGAIFQSLTRNPLGSPDIIGFDAGSYTAVVIVILVVGSTHYWTIAAASIGGGLVTAAAVYLLSWRKGVQGFRLIVVGIGVSALLGSVNSYLITRADVEDAMVVGFWSAGSLQRVTWASLVPSAALAVVLFAASGVLSRPMRYLELGDDAATTLGFRVQPLRLALMVIGVAAVALVTAAAGPIGFIALIAPQLSRRLTRSAGVGLAASACMGAALLALAHVCALLITVSYRTVPVGLLTVCIGGCYMVWLLIRETRGRYRAGTIQ